MRELSEHPSFREGFRAGIPVAIAGTAIAISFGILARPVIGGVEAVAMSALVFAGAAQFGAIAVLAAGGGPLAAIIAGILLNSRYVPMGVALAPSLKGSRARRALTAQAMVDYSWAAAMRGNGEFDRRFMIGATVPMYVTWTLGTALGVVGGDLVGDPQALGLDAMFPAFFLALLLGGEAGSAPRAVVAAAVGGVIALVLIPIAPPGVPVIAACLAALVGLERRRPVGERTGPPPGGRDGAQAA
jgi:4-azaleucine resistance transporter AzlC